MSGRAVLGLIVACAAGSPALSQSIELVGQARLTGRLHHADQLSGAALFGRLLVVCPDEGAVLDVLTRRANDQFEAVAGVELLDERDTEIDMEGVASDGQWLYVVGSHSLARKKLDPSDSYRKNRRGLREIKEEDSRYNVFRLKLDGDGRRVEHKRISLRDVLEKDKILKRFTRLPSKENGIDIEGIAAADGRLFFGFRGPVLRDNFVPIIALRFDDPQEYELMFVDLGGRGVRDLAAAQGGILVLGGPVGDGQGTYELYFWNQKDCLPGKHAPRGTIGHLGTIRASAEAKPEALAVLDETAGIVTVLLLSDGAAERGDLLRVKTPR
jgi:hypothetical protein